MTNETFLLLIVILLLLRRTHIDLEPKPPLPRRRTRWDKNQIIHYAKG